MIETSIEIIYQDERSSCYNFNFQFSREPKDTHTHFNDEIAIIQKL